MAGGSHRPAGQPGVHRPPPGEVYSFLATAVRPSSVGAARAPTLTRAQAEAAPPNPKTQYPTFEVPGPGGLHEFMTLGTSFRMFTAHPRPHTDPTQPWELPPPRSGLGPQTIRYPQNTASGAYCQNHGILLGGIYINLAVPHQGTPQGWVLLDPTLTPPRMKNFPSSLIPTCNPSHRGDKMLACARNSRT